MCFAMNSYDLYTQKKSTFWLHFGSVWKAHVPKTLFFTMNLKDFKGVVFDSQKWPKQWKPSDKMASFPAVMVPDSTGHSIPIRTYAKKVVHVKPPRYLKVSLSANKLHYIYLTRADNEYETNVNASSRLHSLASRVDVTHTQARAC